MHSELEAPPAAWPGQVGDVDDGFGLEPGHGAERVSDQAAGHRNQDRLSARNIAPAAAIEDVHAQCGRELCARACVNMSGTQEPSRSSDDGFAVPWLPAHPPAAPGPREGLAGVRCVDPGRSASRPGVRSTRPCARDVPRPAAGLCGMLPWPPCPGIPEEKSVARPGQRQTGARRTAPRKQRRVHHRGDVVSVLCRTAREVEAAARRGRVTPAVRAKFQAVALLLRDERARVRAAAGSDSRRAGQLKRLDGIAAILATTAVRDAGLLALLAEGSGVSDAARSLKREMLRDLGIAPAPEEIAPAETATASAGSERLAPAPPGRSPPRGDPLFPPHISATSPPTPPPR